MYRLQIINVVDAENSIRLADYKDACLVSFLNVCCCNMGTALYLELRLFFK